MFGGGNILGAPQTITCADGSKQPCAGGSEGCYDNSPMYCKGDAPPRPGAAQTITCPDGSKRSCAGGTQGCYDNSPELCGGPRGGPKTITCPDGSTRTCNHGTRGCMDNSPELCAAPAGGCSPGALAVCVDGSYMELPPNVVQSLFGPRS